MGNVVLKGRCRIELASKVVWEGDPVAAHAGAALADAARGCMFDRKLFSNRTVGSIGMRCWFKKFLATVEVPRSTGPSVPIFFFSSFC